MNNIYTPGEYNDNWIWEVSRMIAQATPEKRKKIKRAVEEQIARDDNSYCVEGYCDRSRAIELAESPCCWGNASVYVWLDKDGIPFYAGKCNDGASRMGEFKYNTRSEDFQLRIAEGGCHAVLLAKHVSPREIDEVEKWLITYLFWKGYPLVNKKDVPNRETLALWSLFQKYENRRDVTKEFDEEIGDLFRDWKTNMRDYTPIIRVLDCVVGVAWDGECADISPLNKKPPETLTYNGETRTYIEWGHHLGIVDGATIRTRIKVLGWDVEKALFTPSAQAASRERMRRAREEKSA